MDGDHIFESDILEEMHNFPLRVLRGEEYITSIIMAVICSCYRIISDLKIDTQEFLFNFCWK